MRDLLVVTGPPGAGKSTVAAELTLHSAPSALVEGDAFFAFVRGGYVPPWLPGSERQNEVVATAAARASAAFVTGGYHTIYDGVLGPWSLDLFCVSGGFATLDYAVLLPSEDECARRVTERSGHGFVDEPAARKMHREFTAAAIDDRHVFVNDQPTARDTVAEVLRRRDDGLLRYSAVPK